MSRRQIILYFDYKSPYAYLAKDPAYALEDDFDVEIDWRPYRLDIPAAHGSVETRTNLEWRKVCYLYMDMRRWANKRGMIVRGPKKVYDSSLALSGMLFARNAGVFHAYHDALFYRFWNHEIDIEDSEAIEAALAEAGADPAGFGAFLESEGRPELRRLKQEAEQAGAFGVPTFVIDGELFWGHDRIDLVRERLAEAT